MQEWSHLNENNISYQQTRIYLYCQNSAYELHWKLCLAELCTFPSFYDCRFLLNNLQNTGEEAGSYCSSQVVKPLGSCFVSWQLFVLLFHSFLPYFMSLKNKKNISFPHFFINSFIVNIICKTLNHLSNWAGEMHKYCFGDYQTLSVNGVQF